MNGREHCLEWQRVRRRGKSPDGSERPARKRGGGGRKTDSLEGQIPPRTNLKEACCSATMLRLKALCC